MLIVIPEQPAIELNQTKADVEHDVRLKCLFSGVSSGNPSSIKTKFRGKNNFEEIPESNETILTINNVNQEQQYSCAGINIPKNKGEKQGPFSESKMLEVLGKSLKYNSGKCDFTFYIIFIQVHSL